MEDLIIHNAEIWTLTDTEAIPCGWLSVKNGVISSLGSGDPPPSSIARAVVDGQGKILMPGLVDCHTHLMEYATLEVHHTQGKAQRMAAVSNLLLALQSGIVATGEHHLGHPVADMPMEDYRMILDRIPMNSSMAYGCCWLGFEPKVLTSATRPGKAFQEDVLTEADFLRMAEASEFPGENLFLNYTCANAPLDQAPHAGEVTYGAQKLAQIIEIFHKKGKRIGAHIEGDDSARRFIECGGDVIHHGHALSSEVGTLMAQKGIKLVLTPVAGTSQRPTSPQEAYGFYRQGIFLALASDAYIYPHPEADWIPLPKDRLAGPAQFLSIVGSTLRYFVEQGVQKSEALKLITVNPRSLLHPSESPGFLQTGSPADMILCNRLPALESEDPADICVVITEGQIQVDRRI